MKIQTYLRRCVVGGLRAPSILSWSLLLLLGTLQSNLLSFHSLNQNPVLQPTFTFMKWILQSHTVCHCQSLFLTALTIPVSQARPGQYWRGSAAGGPQGVLPQAGQQPRSHPQPQKVFPSHQPRNMPWLCGHVLGAWHEPVLQGGVECSSMSHSILKSFITNPCKHLGLEPQQ